MTNNGTFSNYRSRYARCHETIKLDGFNNHMASVRIDLFEAYFKLFEIEIIDKIIDFKAISDELDLHLYRPHINISFQKCKKDISKQSDIFEKLRIYEIFFEDYRRGDLSYMYETPRVLFAIFLNITYLSNEVIGSIIVGKCSRCRKCGFNTGCICGTNEFRRSNWEPSTPSW